MRNIEINYILIGQRIRNLRLERHLTQDALCDVIGISKTHMSHIETGSTKLSLPTILCIANALDTTIDYLLADNLNSNQVELSKDIYNITKDCSSYELRVMSEALRIIKDAIRNSPKKED